MYIYADILIITNIYADFLLIKSAQAITHSPMKTWRGVAAAAAGSLFSLVIFLPRLSPAALILIKLLSAAVIVYAAFGYGSRGAYIKRLFVFWLAAFVYGGAGTAVSLLFGGKVIISRNGVIYADFSMLSLIITTIAAYLCIAIYKRMADCSEEGALYTVIVSDRGRTVSFKALADTGNVLKDSFTGKPVIVCGRDVLASLYGEVPDEDSIMSGSSEWRGWRLIPYSTVSGSGVIPIIRPREICVKNDETGELFRCDAYLGAAENVNSSAVFHPKILV